MFLLKRSFFSNFNDFVQCLIVILFRKIKQCLVSQCLSQQSFFKYETLSVIYYKYHFTYYVWSRVNSYFHTFFQTLAHSQI